MGVSFNETIKALQPAYASTHWSLLIQLSQFIQKSAKLLKVTRLETYLRSKGDLQNKVIRKDWPWHNKGIFTKYERDYLDVISHTLQERYTSFLANFTNPTYQFVEGFWAEYSSINTEGTTIINLVNKIINERQPVLFPSAKKRKKAVLADQAVETVDLPILLKYFNPKVFNSSLNVPIASTQLSNPKLVKKYFNDLRSKAHTATEVSLVTAYSDVIYTRQVQDLGNDFETDFLKDSDDSDMESDA